MASYRFCRSDDLALLARAHARCAHDGLDPADLKRAVREVDLWTSGCMVALDGDEPIGVSLVAKRASEACILSLGVRDDRRRQGHGRHLVESLLSKLAILGPPRLLVEAPASRVEVAAFLEACGFRARAELRDFVAAPAQPRTSALVVPVTLAELAAAGAIDAAVRRSWARDPALLERRADRVRGLAVAAGERIEAALVFDAEGEQWRVLAMRADVLWLRVLLGALAAEAARPVQIARVSEEEVPYSTLAACGFVERERTLVYEASAGASSTR